MDLMTLAAKIILDDSSYTKGIANAEKAGNQLAQKMSAMTVAVGNLAADMVRNGVQAISGVINGAIDGYADYQQLIGGVETLFKTSADKVARYAERSYKTTGLSANAYMETVTSFSASLLQGLNNDTEKAADMANMAVTDMADNANKMGTDISSIQAAYQGFAKQNYTMLDNLKLGYGGTASEMVRLVNDSKILDHEIKNLDGITFDQLVQAIHVASLEAAWTDFLTSIGGEDDQRKLTEAGNKFKETFKTYTVDNLAPALGRTLKNAPELVEAVSDAIISLPSSAISDLAHSGISIITSAVEGATDITGWLIDGLVQMFKDVNADPTQIAELGNAVGEFIGSALSDIVTNAPTIISGLFTAGVTLASSLIEGLFTGLFGAEGLPETLNDIDEEMNDTISDAIANSTRAMGIIQYIEELGEKYGEAAKDMQEYKDAKDFWSAQVNIDFEKSIRDVAATNLLKAFGIYGAVNEYGEQIDQSFDIRGSNQQIYDSLISRLVEATGGPGNQAYEDAMEMLNNPEYHAKIMGWITELKDSGSEIERLEGTVADLEKQLAEAESSYQLCAAAVDNLASSANAASGVIGGVSSVALNSGEYAAWVASGGTYMPRAVGIDYVPTDNFRTELHRGEAVLNRSDADRYRNGGDNAALIAEVQGVRNDMNNLKLVVGKKTFGRAVVDYGGERARNYIGEADSKAAAGYGT